MAQNTASPDVSVTVFRSTDETDQALPGEEEGAVPALHPRTFVPELVLTDSQDLSWGDLICY